MPHDRGPADFCFKYNLLSLLAGWWGIPWGPIHTISTVAKNIGGGTDVTADIVRYLQDQGRLPHAFDM